MSFPTPYSLGRSVLLPTPYSLLPRSSVGRRSVRRSSVRRSSVGRIGRSAVCRSMVGRSVGRSAGRAWVGRCSVAHFKPYALLPTSASVVRSVGRKLASSPTAGPSVSDTVCASSPAVRIGVIGDNAHSSQLRATCHSVSLTAG